LGDGSGDDIRKSGAQIGDGDLIDGMELVAADDNSAMQVIGVAVATRRTAEAVAGELGNSAELAKRLEVAEAVFVNRLMNNRNALALGEKDSKRLLPIG